MFANLKKAAWDRETVTIGGGDFHRDELLEAAHMLECYPVMLEALKKLDNFFETYRPEDHPVSDPHELVRAAIAAATKE